MSEQFVYFLVVELSLLACGEEMQMYPAALRSLRSFKCGWFMTLWHAG